MESQENQVVADVERARLTLRISGQVQGVGFRYYVRRAVAHLSVTGWVRNDADGVVSIVAEGPVDHLNKLLEAVERGPSAADVEEVDATWTSAFGAFDDFKVKLW